MPIRWKLILAIGGPLVLLMSTLLVLDYLRLRGAAVRQNDERVKEIALRHAARYEGLFNTLAQTSRMAAAFVSAHHDLNEAEVYELLRENVERNPLIYGSCLAFEPGAFTQRVSGIPSGIAAAERPRADPKPGAFAPYVFRSGDRLARLDIAEVYDYSGPDWEWYDAPRRTGKESWTDPYFDKDAGDVPMVTFSAPIIREGRFIGVATVDVQLERLRRISLDKRPPETEVYIIDRQGRYLLAPASPLIMSETVYETAEKIKSPELMEIVERAMSGAQGTGVFFDPDRQRRSLVYFAPIEGTGWALGCVSPENYFLGAQLQGLRWRAGIGAAIVAGILAIVALMGSWIVRPVGRLAAAVEELGAGNLSTVVRSRSGDEIGQLARGFNAMTAELRRHVDALTQETAARQAVESELSIARAIQTSLLPRSFPQRREFEVFALSSPARQVGGDFFDCFFMDDNVLTIAIADVSGKGVPAAIFMAVARTVVRDLAAAGRPSPSEILNRVNRVLVGENSEGMFVTMILGQYDLRTGALRYACAGHPPAYLLTAAGHIHRCTESTGTVLGIIKDEQFAERTVMLVPGDRIVLYTDGVPEARAPGGAFFREDRFEDLLVAHSSRSPRGLCEDTLAEVLRYQNGDPHDDITLMVLSRSV
jgi:phosphoserine phosphatase RsbU/P